MDQPDLPDKDHRQALVGLARLNRWTGVALRFYRHLKNAAMASHHRRLRILDVASGAADLPIYWAARGRRDGLSLEVTTLDVSKFAIRQQRRRARQCGVRLRAIRADCLKEGLPEGFDVVTNSLFLHHLDESDAIRLVDSMLNASRGDVLVSDLERSRTNLALVKAGSHLLSRSPVVHHDGPLSVRGAFTRAEMQSIAGSASGHPVTVTRLFPCRMWLVLQGRGRD